MTSKEAYQLVVSVLNRERAMRVRVFRADPKRLAQKTQEIDDAIAALGVLTKAAERPEFVAQSTMFDATELDTPKTKAVRSY